MKQSNMAQLLAAKVPYYAGIAQLVEHLTCNEDVAGSSPVSSSIHSWIAQLVEQSAVNRSVVGSSPTPGAIYHAGIAQR